MPDDVAACITRGLAGFRHVVVVSSATDPRIRTRPLHGGAIPVIDHGFVVAFGPVPTAAGRTEIGVDTGGGFGARGGEFCVRGETSQPLVSACGAQWIS